MKNSKSIRKLLVLSLIVVIGLMGVSCKGESMLGETEYLKYAKYSSRIAIRELTIMGQELDELIIPKEIDGKPVTHIGEKTMGQYFILESSNLRILNLPDTIIATTGMTELTALETLILNSTTPLSFGEYASMKFHNASNVKIYVPKGFAKQYKDAQSFADYKFFEANISFMYNYENSPNADFYFINHLEEAGKLIKPQDPKRENYTFVGWYEDEGCLLEYDFDTIIDGEKMLFAGWEHH